MEDGNEVHLKPAIQRFPLTRYFVVTGVVTAVVVAIALAAAAAREIQEDLVRSHEERAVLIAKNLNRQVHEHVGPAGQDRLAEMDRVVRLGIAELNVQRVYFFDMDGRITYATRKDRVGTSVRPDNENFNVAKQGKVSTELKDVGSHLDVSGEARQTLLETYVPVYALRPDGTPTDRQQGVIEIYQVATGLVAESRKASARVATFSTIGILALMLALWLWIQKAERTIDERSQELLDVNTQLAALSADLERQVEDRTRQLVRAETLATVGTLSAGVAHEVNNPIAAIASCAEGLLRRAKSEDLVDRPDFEDFPEYLQIIRDEAFRVKEITRNLLDFSRTGDPAQREAVDLSELMEAAARLVDHQVQQEGKHLQLDLPPEPVVVQADGAGLRQLVLNVTLNAIEASPEGSTVRWTVRGAGGGAELVCEDQGPGFSPEELERAFEPFFTSKPTGRGTGLGLAIAYSVARQHDGRIELGNVSGGEGARVVVHLDGSPSGNGGGDAQPR